MFNFYPAVKLSYCYVYYDMFKKYCPIALVAFFSKHVRHRLSSVTMRLKKILKDRYRGSDLKYYSKPTQNL